MCAYGVKAIVGEKQPRIFSRKIGVHERLSYAISELCNSLAHIIRQQVTTCKEIVVHGRLKDKIFWKTPSAVDEVDEDR